MSTARARHRSEHGHLDDIDEQEETPAASSPPTHDLGADSPAPAPDDTTLTERPGRAVPLALRRPRRTTSHAASVESIDTGAAVDTATAWLQSSALSRVVQFRYACDDYTIV